MNSAIDEAAQWLAVLTDGSCTEAERREFARWLARSNLNVEEFLRLSVLTRRLEKASHWPETDIAQLVEQDRADATGVARLPFLRGGGPSAPRGRLRLYAAAVAASLVIALLASFFLLDAGQPFAKESYATRLGELRSITLEDGSIIQLDAESRMRTRFDERQRRVELLKGEAIFRVAKDAGRPFWVETPQASVRAVGTAFDVSTRRQHTVVTVIEGRVAVLPANSASVSAARDAEAAGGATSAVAANIGRMDGFYLDPGQQAVIAPREPVQRVPHVDAAKVTGWASRRLYFDETPLSQAVSEFARYSAQTIRIEDPGLAGKRISGVFDSSNPAALIEFLSRYGDAVVSQSDSGWVVGRPAVTERN